MARSMKAVLALALLVAVPLAGAQAPGGAAAGVPAAVPAGAAPAEPKFDAALAQRMCSLGPAV